MKRNSVILGLVLSVMFAACGTADQKVPAIADDFCNCFKKLEGSMSEGAKDLLLKAAESAAPESTLQSSLMALEEDKRMAIAQEMMAFQDAQDPSSELNKCIKSLEDKYKDDKTRDKKKFGEKLLSELKSKKGCEVTYAIMKIGFKQEFK